MITRAGRLRKSAQAALFGWLTGLLATLPFQVLEVVRNSGAEPRLFLSALGYGLTVWALFTFAGILAAWLLLVMPIAILFTGEWLLKHDRAAVLLSGLLGVLAAVFEFRIWTIFDHWPADMTVFWLYMVFTMSFSAATCWCYLRLLTRAARERYAQQR